MNALISLHNGLFRQVEKLSPFLLPTLARLVFAAVLLMYYWNSAMTKIGSGILGFVSLDFGAYAQMFPKQFEAVGYDPSALGFSYKLIAILGTWAEFILPLLIVIGLFTRLASIGMIGFITVQSVVDITGHSADAATIGTWFDRIPDAHILDQRAFWMFILLYLVLRGGGPLAVDRLVLDRAAAKPQAESG